MDPLSITASAIGITVFATTSISQLRNGIESLSEAQDVVADIASSLANIQRPLAALEQLSISDEACAAAAKEDLRKAGVAEAVNKCGNACNDFNKDLTRWTKHSNAKLSLRDRLTVGIWNKEKIRTFNMHLQSCEATLQIAVTSTQLMVQLRSEKLSENDRENLHRQLNVLETKIQEHMDLTVRQAGEVQQRLRNLQEESEDEDEDDSGVKRAQRTLAITEVEKQSGLLEADQVSCGVVFSQVRSARSGQDISNVITSENSKAIVGLPESVVGKVNQRIRNVKTEGSSVAVVGVYSGSMSFKDL